MAWYANDGSGNFGAQQNISFSGNAVQIARAADLDGDGDLDVFAASFYDNKIAWYMNDGTGLFSQEKFIDSLAGAANVNAADLDSDGDLDVLASGGSTVAWYENMGTGFSGRQSITTTTAGSGYLLVVDLNGDGDLDVLSSANGTQIVWYRNDTIHRSAYYPTRTPISTIANGAAAVFVADLDRDGDRDVLSASIQDDTIAWYVNSNHGQNWTRLVVTSAADGADAVFAADIDRDGDLDVVAASLNDGRLRWYANNGFGGGWTARVIATGVMSPRALTVADLDRDGDLDVLTADLAGNRILWLENNGTGTSWTMNTVSTAVSNVASLLVADLNRDGKPDVIAASPAGNSVTWFAGDGTGDNWTPAPVTSTAAGADSVQVADMDRDGDLDIIAADQDDGLVAWYANDGTGNGWALNEVTASANQAQAVYAADLDHDGDVDILLASAADNAVTWFANDGTGTGWTPTVITTAATSAAAVYAADLDGDGDLDALSASPGDQTIAWYPNQGGQFALTTTATAPATLDNGQTDDLLRIDLAHRGRIGDHDLEWASLVLLFEESAGDPLTSAEANALIDNLFVYRDGNGDGIFEANLDTLVTTVATLSLTAGKQTVTFTDNDTNVRVTAGVERTYFVVAQLTADANTKSPARFQVTHVTSSGSTAEDRINDFALSLEASTTVTTGLVGPATTSAPTVTDPTTAALVNTANYTISGTAPADSLVRVYRDGNNNNLIDGSDSVVATQQLSAGATTFAISTPLVSDSANNFLVTARAPGRVESAAVDVPTITQDGTPPALPTVTLPASALTLNANNFTIQGTAEANSLVRIYSDLNDDGLINGADAVVGSQQLTGGGTNFSIQVALTQDATNSFLVTATDSVSNESSPANVPTMTEDSTPPTVTINQTAGQADAAMTGPIQFTIVFSEPVTGFTASDVSLSGSAGATTVNLVEVGPLDGTTFRADVTGMTRAGTVLAAVTAGVAVDAAGTGNLASTSTDNLVLFGAVTATGRDTGKGRVNVYDAATGRQIAAFTAYNVAGYNGGARVAVADVTGDGLPEVITASGSSLAGGALVKVYDGAALLTGTATVLFSFHPYGTSYTGPLFVAASRFNGDNLADIFTSNVSSGGPLVKVFDGADLAAGDAVLVLGSVRPFGTSYAGGARVAVGDVNGDGQPDVIAGQSVHGSLVRAYSGVQILSHQAPHLLTQVTAGPAALAGGVFVAAGNLDGDTRIDIMVGLGAGTPSLVKAYEDASDANTTATLLKQGSFVYGGSFTGGIRVATVDLNGDGKVEIQTTAGSGLASYRLRILKGLALTVQTGVFVEAPNFTEARFVAAARLG